MAKNILGRYKTKWLFMNVFININNNNIETGTKSMNNCMIYP